MQKQRIMITIKSKRNHRSDLFNTIVDFVDTVSQSRSLQHKDVEVMVTVGKVENIGWELRKKEFVKDYVDRLAIK